VGVTHWMVTVQYTYATPSADPAQRRWNPLGFRILDFHAEPELPDAPNPPATTPATTVATAAPTPGATP